MSQIPDKDARSSFLSHVKAALALSFIHAQTPLQCSFLPTSHPYTTSFSYFPVFTFFFFGSTALSSSLPAPSASAISSSLPLPLLSWAESYSSATSDSESDWKSSSTLSSSSSAEPRSARAATTSSSEESMLASLRAAWIRAEDWGRVSIQ